MGWEKLATPLLGSLVGGMVGNKNPQPQTQTTNQNTTQNVDQTSTSTNQLSPQMQAILFGSQKKLKEGAKPVDYDMNGGAIYAPDAYEPAQQGLLSSIQAQMGKPQSAGMQAAGNYSDNYLQNNYGADQFAMRNAAQNLLGGNAAPSMQAAQASSPAAYKAQLAQLERSGIPKDVAASMIQAPSQNQIDLKSQYQNIINQEGGNNPYLTGGIQKGINQSTNAFQNMIDDAKRSTQDVLSGIRGGAIASGGYGGSRQGLLESRALDDMSRNLGRAATTFGQSNTDAAVAAQAGQYNQDMANKLNAMGNLNQNQYSVAGQNAQNQQQANLTNYQGQLSNNQLNANLANQNSQFNANSLNDAMKLEYQAKAQAALANAGFANQANNANLQAQLGTNQLNQQGQQAGAGLLGNIQNQNMNVSNANNNYQLNQLGQIGNLLQPWQNAGATQTNTTKGTTTGTMTGTSTQPMYQNNAANAMGGAALGLQLYNQFAPMFAGGTPSPSSAGAANVGSGLMNFFGNQTGVIDPRMNKVM